MKLPIPGAVSRKFAQQSLMLQKHSPSLFFAVGVAGTITSTALACRATLKLEEVAEKAENDTITAQNIRVTQPDQYSEEDLQSDLKLIRVRTAVDIAKLYAPAVVVGGFSIAALTHSHNLLSKRNAAITAAYAALDKGFREYRDRVVEQYGEDKDRELRYGSEIVTVKDPKTGRAKNLIRVGEGTPSIYAKFFDEYNANWSKEPEYNLIFLRAQQNWANDMLRARGHVSLNDVYDALGIERTKEGFVVGWLLGDEMSDNYIDFGIWDSDNQNSIDFVNGREGSILLDFNVDGLIFDKIGNQEEVKWQS